MIVATLVPKKREKRKFLNIVTLWWLVQLFILVWISYIGRSFCHKRLADLWKDREIEFHIHMIWKHNYQRIYSLEIPTVERLKLKCIPKNFAIKSNESCWNSNRVNSMKSSFFIISHNNTFKNNLTTKDCLSLTLPYYK